MKLKEENDWYRMLLSGLDKGKSVERAHRHRMTENRLAKKML
jgi:hypothetical protein